MAHLTQLHSAAPKRLEMSKNRPAFECLSWSTFEHIPGLTDKPNPLPPFVPLQCGLQAQMVQPQPVVGQP